MRRTRVVGLGVLLALAGGCDRKAQDAPEAGAVAAADPSASAEVAAPPPVVSGDPDIPLNEAVVGAAPVPADYSADIAPPAAATEEQPASPEAGDVWVPGYWWWSTTFHRYVWVSGAWRNPPPDQVWTHGEWVSNPAGRYVWVPGFWGSRGTPAPPAIGLAPPPPEFETRPPPPEVGYDWTPGYYAYRGERYVWVGGLWARPPREGLGWIEPRYVGVGGHYYFQPGRWDQPVGRRGTVYMPDPNVRAGTRFTPVAASQTLVQSHATYVVNASHAIARGAYRTPTGGYAISGGGGSAPHAGGPLERGGGALPGGEHGGNPPPAGTAEHGGVQMHEPPGGGEQRVEPHGGASPGGTSPQPHGSPTTLQRQNPGVEHPTEGNGSHGATPPSGSSGHHGEHGGH